MKYSSKDTILALAVSFGAVAFAAGCATTEPLKSEASTSNIRAAEAVGAKEVPRAALHLQLAKEALAKAQKLSKDGDMEEAHSMLMRAEADAELAVALSREAAERSEAERAIDSVKKLRQENE